MDVIYRKAKQVGVGENPAEKQWLCKVYQSLQECLCVEEWKEEEFCSLVLSVVERIISVKVEDTNCMAVPVRYDVLCINTLLQSQQVSCFSNLRLPQNQYKKVVNEAPTGHKPLRRIYFLLLGKLTADPKSINLAVKDKCGDLYLEDNTGSVICQCIKPDVNWLDKLVLIPAWNYIVFDTDRRGMKHKSSAYLEITEACVPVGNLPRKVEPGPEIEVVSSTLGLHILQNRCDFSNKYVNIQGEITSLSPVHRIHESVLFFVEITSKDCDTSVCVVAKGAEYCYWHNFLQLNEEYVFSEVMPTTLNKESINSFPVYAVCKKTRFFPLSGRNFENINLQQLQEKYPYRQSSIGSEHVMGNVSSSHGDQQPSTSCQGDVDIMSSEECVTSSTSKQVKHAKLCSFQGTITDVTIADAGIYQLDGKIRLYIGHQPCLSHGRGLRVGSKVKVYNAHFKTSKEEPTLRLCCCTLSSVVIVQFSPLTTPYQPFIPHSSVYIHLLYFYHLNLAYYQWLVEMSEDMKKKFLPNLLSDTSLMGVQLRKNDRSHQRAFGVFYSLFRLPSPSKQKLLLPQSPRNIYQEFIDPQHSCWVVESQPVSRASMYAIPPMAELKQTLERLTKTRESWQLPQTRQTYRDKSLNEELYWRYQINEPSDFKPPLLLVGYLEINSKTGQLQLTDQTGSIDCVVSQMSTDSHVCDHKCQYPSKNSHQPYVCPNIKFWCSGQMIRIDRYQIINESFTVSRFPSIRQVGNLSCIDKQHLRSYVQFSMSDSVCLHRKKFIDRERRKRKLDEGTNSTSVSTNKGPLGSNPNTDSVCVTDVVQLFVVSQKDSLHLTRSIKTESSELTSNITVTFINPSIILQQDDKYESAYISSATARNKTQVAMPTKHHGNRNNSTQSCAAVDKKSEGVAMSTHHHGERHNSSGSCAITTTGNKHATIAIATNTGKTELRPSGDCNSDLPVKQVVLVLAAETIKWYHLLNPGQTYVLVMPGSKDVKVFEPQLPSQALQRVVRATDCRTCLLVTNNMVVMPTACPQPHANIAAKVTNEIYILSDDEAGLRDQVVSRLSSKEETNILNVHEITTTSRSTTDVREISLKCRILSRRHYNAESRFKSTSLVNSPDRDAELGVSTLNNKSICLLVGDISSQGTLSIYIDVNGLSYPLGLLPGAIVTFRNLNLCMSRKSNIYCQYVCNSSVVIDKCAACIPLQRNTTTQDTGFEKENQPTLPHKYLCEYAQTGITNTGLTNINQIYAHIVIVQNLSLRFSCAKCGDIFKQGVCMNTRGYCPSTNATYTAKASFIIEDGTFEAHVHCNNEQVTSLLELSTLQCQRLQECVYKWGEVVYRHKGSEYNRECEHYGHVNPVERVLNHLCSSQLVCRPVVLCCRQFRPSQDVDNKNHDYRVRNWDNGDIQIQTKVLPKLSLFCTSLKSVNYREVYNNLMADNTS